jgi:outer membrane receptor protein involved in Fe transport
MKLSVEGLYGVTNTVNQTAIGLYENYLTSGEAIFNSPIYTGSETGYYEGALTYQPYALRPFNIYRAMQGLSFDHVLSPSTFYNVRVSVVTIKNDQTSQQFWRNTNAVRYFGNKAVDEQPWGYQWVKGLDGMVDGMYMGGGHYNMDDSKATSINAKVDITSQIDKNNQVKAGIIFNYDDMDTHYENIRDLWPNNGWKVIWSQAPYRIGAYLQDKLEFEGLIANLGIRVDYSNPNSEWYTVDKYSKYFTSGFKYKMDELAPKAPTDTQIKISPRLGISHPVSANAKFYFNYGHFYSMPTSRNMYEIDYGRPQNSINFLGNPNAILPKTVAYELGLEYDIANMFLLHISGYYKDVSDQTGSVKYTSLDGSVSYSTIENNNYEDIRGFELRLEKRFGKWITGWMNYNYMVTTSGYVGRKSYYQDARLQRIYGLQNPYQEVPLARPVVRANVLFRTPSDLGPMIAGIRPLSDIDLSVLFTWQSGRYETWDPLNTYLLKDNLHWKGNALFDAKLGKLISIGKFNLTIFADVKNLFNTKYIYTQGFKDSNDKKLYLQSLHLPMYSEQIYQDAGYEVGNDKAGDIKSDDKPYIDMPNRDFLTFLDVRSILFGFFFYLVITLQMLLFISQ